ncbi:putative virion structural protein [Erwinia phage vB_EamM_Phobos]|uniref:putative virion structural protein n=1 Tax=Erwinia phage vB_EamM_Phobos TaxID=1883377 RepID=UPI00081CBB6C|nr:putative virion structural protein [Erwinia phage vB_EamM_Phobos]ANZ50343.1 putative virion structural protein [Erwinia phage vB_EamM_Phobos]
MALKLKWKNPNKGATSVEIYRGDTPDVDLTTPLVTLSSGELAWVDTTALFGSTYYYVWAVNTANDRVVSRPQKVEVADRKGPGPNTLQAGNESYGYFGSVPSADFVNSSTVLAALKTLSGIPGGTSYPTWYKFIRNGKVLFVPNTTFGDVSWISLYNAGAVYGTDDNGGVNSPNNVNQMTTFELNGDLFLVRLAKGVPENMEWDGTAVNLNTLPAAQGIYAEYEDLMYPLITLSPLRKRMVTVDAVNPTSIIPSGTYSNRTSYGVVMQEAATVANSVQRGGGTYNYDAHSRGTIESFSLRGRTSACCWWPVIEYIGRVGEINLANA